MADPNLTPSIQAAILCDELLPTPADVLDSRAWEVWEATHLAVHDAAYRIAQELRDAPELVSALIEAVAA